MMPSHQPCRPPARLAAILIARTLRRAASLPPSSWLIVLTRRALPYVTGSSSLLNDSMRLVEFVEEDAVGNPHIDFALVVI